ncbi:MAG: hypothetical protein Kow0068_18680 [Marinilabiliales bacterium]
MKTILLFLIIVINGSLVFSQDWLYSNSITSNDICEITDMVTDSSNNCYIIGRFNGTIDYGIGNYTTFNAGTYDVFIAKYSSSGNIQWVKRIGGDGNETITGIALDSNNDLLVTGVFSDDCKFEIDTLINTGANDIYIAKYSSNGSYLWSKRVVWGSTGQISNDICVDINDNIVISGFYQLTAYFGVDTLHYPGNDTLTSLSSFDAFFAKFDNDGNFIWAKNVTDKLAGTLINSNSSGTDGYYFSISYKDSLFLDIDSLYSAGSYDVALYKTDFNGDGLWLRDIKGTGNDASFATCNTTSDNIVVAGHFNSPNLSIDSTDTELSLATYTNKGSNDIFIACYNNSGTLQWVDFNGDVGDDKPYDLSSNNNEIILSGHFADTIVFNSDTLTSLGTGDKEAFFTVYDEIGNKLFGKKLRGTSSQEDIGKAGAIDDAGNYYISGNYKSDTLFVESDIDPTNIDTLLNPVVGVYDAFIAKYGCQAVALSFIMDSVTCAGGNDGQIVLQPSVIDNYTYTWSGGYPNNDTIINVSEGTYYVTVTSPRGCMYTDSVTMAALPPLHTSLVDSITINCVGGNDGVAIVTPVDGVGPFTYAWSGSASIDSTASDLNVGLHYVTVTDQCGDVVDSVNVGYMPTLTTSMSTHSLLVLCATSTDGEATVTPVNGVGPYNYIWSTSANDTLPTNSNLPVGLHYVTVTDVCNVPTIDSVQVNYLPTMNASITEFDDASCSSTSDGEAYVFATSGVPPYTYLWDNGDTLAQTNSLDTGWHYVTVTDFCISITDSVEIGFNTPMSINITSSVDVSCPGASDGQACVNVNNGTSPYFYTWAGSSSTNSCVSDLSVGWQSVTVTDYCGSLADSVFIGTQPSLSLTTEQITPATCVDDSNATAIVHLTNGTAPFTFTWSNSTSIDSIANDLPIGYQYVTVTDGCGTKTDSILITSMPPLSVTYDATNILCYGDTTGTIELITSDGVMPFTYLWSVSDSDSVVVNLPAGMYYYTVTDICGSVTGNVELTQPGAISVSADITNESFNGTHDGKIDIIVSGGTAPYSYYWSDYDNSITEDIEGLTEGTYIVTITDYNSCTYVDTFSVSTEYHYIEIMNAFTPNGDGVNDEWTIKYIDQYPACQVDVYDQWGIVVFSSTGYTEKWNGKKNNSGSDMPAASYYYIIDLKDGSDKYTGSVTIIR